MHKISVTIATLYKKYSNWIFKGGLSILDQAFYSGANFVASLLLARWLDVHDFGIYAFAAAFFSLFYQLQNALIIEPMSVIGPANYYDSIDHYLSQQQKIHFILFIPLGVLIIGITAMITVISGNNEFSQILIILGLFASLIQLPWFTRRVFYVTHKPIYSVIFSIIYGFIFLGSLFMTYKSQWLSASISLVLMSAAGIVAAICVKIVSRPKKTTHLQISLRTIWNQNWKYGKWMLLTGVLFFLAGQAPIFLTGLMINVDASGVIKALQNFMLPVSMSISAIVALTVPTLSKDFAQGNKALAKSKNKMVTIEMVILSVIYEIFLVICAVPLENFLYNGRYHEYAAMIPLWGLPVIFQALASGFSAEIRAAQKPQGIFITAIIWASVALISNVLFIHWWGILGATLSTVLSYGASFISYYYVVRRIETL